MYNVDDEYESKFSHRNFSVYCVVYTKCASRWISAVLESELCTWN